MPYQQATDRIGALVDDNATNKDDISHMLRDQFVTVQHSVVNAANEFTLVPVTTAACFIVSCSFVTESGVPVVANSLSAEIYYDDGAGGAAVSLSDVWDGTAAVIAADQSQSFAHSAADLDVDDGQGDRDPGAPIENPVEEAVLRVLVVLEISVEALLYRQELDQPADSRHPRCGAQMAGRPLRQFAEPCQLCVHVELGLELGRQARQREDALTFDAIVRSDESHLHRLAPGYRGPGTGVSAPSGGKLGRRRFHNRSFVCRRRSRSSRSARSGSPARTASRIRL